MGEAKEEEEEKGGGSLSVAPERRRGNHRDGDLHQQLRRRQHQLSPPLCSGVTPLFPHCNVYLNMVLHAIYYYPIMCGYPMMFE